MSLRAIGQTVGTRAHKNEDFLLDFTRSFLALFDQADDEYYVISHVTIGGTRLDINVPHPTFPQAVILDMEASLLDPAITDPDTNTLASRWKIDIQYGTWNPLTHSVDGNPINLPTTFHFDFTLAEKAAFTDVDGDPIVNGAGDPYDPPLMREVTRCTLIVRRNELATAVNLPTLAALCNTINAATFNGFPPKTVRLAPIKMPEVLYSQVTNQFYLPMQYEFDIDFDTWVVQVINAGFRQLDSTGHLIPILVNGQPCSTPVPLDEEGHAILAPEFVDSSGDVPPDTSPGGESGEVPGGGEPPEGGTGSISSSNLVIDAYDMKRVADFTVLGMNTLFTLPSLGP